MTLSQLRDVAANVNADESLMGRSGNRKIKTKTNDVKEMRAAVAAFLTKYANEEDETQDEEEEEDEEEGEEEDESESKAPEWMRIGAKVLVDIDEDEPQPGAIDSVDDDDESCAITLDDGSAVVSPWEYVQKLSRKAKKR